MNKYIMIIVLMLVVPVIGFSAQNVSIDSPLSYQKLCGNGEITVKWNYSGKDDFYVRVVFRHIPAYYSLTVADSVPVSQGFAVVGKPHYFIDYRPFDLVLKNTETGEELAVAKSITVYNRPTIYEQSNISTVCKGHPLKLFVKADGDFQSVTWFKDGKPIQGANEINLWLRNSDVSDNGTYKCVLNSNSTCGNAESKEMNVLVDDGPDILQQPENIPFVRGRDAHFIVKAHLTPDDSKTVKFQWWRDSIFSYIDYINGKEVSHTDTTLIPICDGPKYAGANSDYLSVKMTTVWDKSNYYCQIITDWGCTFSQSARVIDWFDVITLKNRFDGCVGDNGLFEVTPIGIDTNEVTYQWYKSGWKVLPEGDKFKGTKTRFLKIIEAQPIDNGIYYCRITHPKTGYYANSQACFLYVKQKPIIRKTSGDYVVNNHDNRFYGATDLWAAVANNFNDPCSFEWYKDGKRVGQCTQSFECHYLPYNPFFRPAEMSDTGKYVCRIYNGCGEVWTDTMRVIWGYEDVVVCEGKDALLQIDKYANSDDYNYKWQKNEKKIVNGNRIKGASSNTLEILGCDSADIGDYYITAVNKYNGTEYSMGKIYLNVKTIPKFTHQPSDTVYDFGDLKELFTIYTPFAVNYQLYYEGEPFGAANILEPILEQGGTGFYVIYLSVVANTSNPPEGKYQLRIWNECGETWGKVFVYSKPGNITKGEIKNDDGNVAVNNSDTNPQGKDEITGVDDLLYTESHLEAFPNPAASGTTIEWYGLGETDFPMVEIYNSYGSKIIGLTAGGLSGRGAATFYWNGMDSDGNVVPSGLYFAKVISHGVVKTIGVMVSR